MWVFIFFLCCLFATSHSISNRTAISVLPDCSEMGDCINNDNNCENKCGCSGATKVMFYNETLDECVLNVKQLLNSLTEQYNTQDRIRDEVDRVFKGIVVAVTVFITCAGLCFVTACVYCCRISYMDHKLRNDVDALSSKLKRDGILRKTIKKPQRKPAEESCNVIVQSAGVYVV